MRALGWIILAIAMLIGIHALNMDTSVDSGLFGRIYNIGLMSEKQNYLMIASACFIGGLLMVIFGGRAGKSERIQTREPKISIPFYEYDAEPKNGIGNGNVVDHLDALERLERLRESGALNEGEFKAQKQRLFSVSQDESITPSPLDWAICPLKKYAEFTGRASRAEFWWFNLMLLIVAAVVMVFEQEFRIEPIISIYTLPDLLFVLVTLVPTIAVSVRRLHDTDRTGYWALLYYCAPLALFVYQEFTDPNELRGFVYSLLGLYFIGAPAATPGPNKYGEDPYRPEGTANAAANIQGRLESDQSSFTGSAPPGPQTFLVVGALLVFVMKIYVGGEAAKTSTDYQPQILTETSDAVDLNFAETDPASLEPEDSAERAPVEADPPSAAEEASSSQTLPVVEQVKERAANFDFQTAPIVRAKQRAVEKGKAIRWRSEEGSGYAVPSSITEVQGRPCRTVYITYLANGEEGKSPSETLCRISSGNWETAG